MKAVEELAQLTNTNQTQTEKDDLIREQIDNTPFWAIGKNNKFHITLGKYRVTNQEIIIPDNYDIKEIISEYLYTNQFNIMLSIALIAITEQPNITTQKTKDGTN